MSYSIVDRLFETLFEELAFDGESAPEEHPSETQSETLITVDDYMGSIDEDIASDERHLIDGGIRDSGIEAIAFYKSRRYRDIPPYKGYWGIFYLYQGLLSIRDQLNSHYSHNPHHHSLAYEFIKAHEFCHYRQDIQTVFLELTQRQHLYGRVRQMFRGQRQNFVEEALANRRALRWASKPIINIADFAEDFMQLQPGAYARFHEWPHGLRSEWIANVSDLSRIVNNSHLARVDWVEALPRAFDKVSLCPEYIIQNAVTSNWIPHAHALPEVNEICDKEKWFE